MTALISWGARNFVDSATITFSSGGEETAFPIANVKKRGLADVFTSKVQSPTEALEILIDNSAVAYRKRDDTFTPNVDGNVNALAVQSDGCILLGGDYSTVAGVARSHLARVLPDGRLDESFAVALDGEINALVLQSDGKIVIGGAFTTVNGTAQAYIARLHPSGALDTSFAPSLDAQVNALVLQSDGKIVIGGAFTTVNGDTRGYFARVLASGATDTGFVADANNTVYALAIDSAGKIVVGGAFTSIGGSTRNRIARVTSAGAVESFDPNANNTVFAIAPKSDGTLYVGGSFTSIGGATRNRIARLLSTGSADTGWNPGGLVYGADDSVYALVTLPDGGVFVGGAQNSIGDETSRVVGRVSTSGAVSTGFTFINDTGTARALAITGGSIIVGGYISDHGNVLKIRTQAPGVARVVALIGVGISEAQYGESISIHARNTADESWTLLHTWSLGTETLGGRSLPPMMVAAVPDGIAESAQFRITTDAAKEYPLTIARVWIGDAIVLDDGIDGGWSMSFVDSGSIDATSGRQWVESVGVRTRVLTMPIEGGRETETAWGFTDAGIADGRPSLHALQLEAGTTSEVLAIARTATPSWVRHSAIYGHIDQPWAIGHKAGPYWGSTLTVVEER